MEQEKKDSTPLTTGEIRWKANEYVYHKKSVDWYWYFGLIVLVLIASSIYLHNVLFAFIIAISAFTMLIYSNKHPRELEYVANKRGISFDTDFYDYKDIQFFYIIDDKKQSEEKLLLIQLKKAISPIIIIPLGNEEVDKTRTFLLNFIEEKKISVPFSYVFANLIGF
jgi:hypothetical protein